MLNAAIQAMLSVALPKPADTVTVPTSPAAAVPSLDNLQLAVLASTQVPAAAAEVDQSDAGRSSQALSSQPAPSQSLPSRPSDHSPSLLGCPDEVLLHIAKFIKEDKALIPPQRSCRKLRSIFVEARKVHNQERARLLLPNFLTYIVQGNQAEAEKILKAPDFERFLG